jgi:hypothetical protein
MSVHRPPAPFPVYVYATTVGPQVARTITTSPVLEARALAGILDQGGERLRVFRQSSTDHDNLSCEVYARAGDGWKRMREERVKYVPPDEMPGTRSEIDGVPVWSHERIDAAQIEVLRRLLRPRT